MANVFQRSDFDDIVYFDGLDAHGLYLVRPPRCGVPSTCDIIIVHGLNGGTAKTYRHPKTDNIWFRDILPEHVVDRAMRTNARIWTYGYNATYTFQNAGQAGAFDFGLELLESVLHVRKRALVQARTRERYTSILQATVGIIFLGTPHQGAALATVTDNIHRIGEAVTGGFFGPNRAVVQGLKRSCSALFESANGFGNICGGIRIFSFFETEGIVIVDRNSAATHLPTEVLGPMNASHRNMCKFRDKFDANYHKIRRCIHELMKRTAPNYIDSRSVEMVPHSNSTPAQLPPPISCYPRHQTVIRADVHRRSSTYPVEWTTSGKWDKMSFISSTSVTPTKSAPSVPNHSVPVCNACMYDSEASRIPLPCTECEDYNHYVPGYQNNRGFNAHHSNHRGRCIPKIHIVQAEDLNPQKDNFNLEPSAYSTFCNWIIEGDQNQDRNAPSTASASQRAKSAPSNTSNLGAFNTSSSTWTIPSAMAFKAQLGNDEDDEDDEIIETILNQLNLDAILEKDGDDPARQRLAFQTTLIEAVLEKVAEEEQRRHEYLLQLAGQRLQEQQGEQIQILAELLLAKAVLEL